jgi:hypothetical protein
MTGFLSYFRLLWTSDRLTYTRQHDTERRGRTSIQALGRIRAHELSVQEMKAYASDRAANGSGRSFTIRLEVMAHLYRQSHN